MDFGWFIFIFYFIFPFTQWKITYASYLSIYLFILKILQTTKVALAGVGVLQAAENMTKIVTEHIRAGHKNR